ncbi:MAG TPA: ATP-binding protein [Phycisphaerales bacterium]|nr:ATP-binding protein [Phycisphaerales bacterium]
MQQDLLITTIQTLARARNLDDVTAAIRASARRLIGSDGVCFVLRDGDSCHYLDEDAIGPLWKGQRFPLETCLTGWVMLNEKPAVVPDIFADDRIPHAAYAPTFVKSLAAVPIRRINPIGAISAYWARKHTATPEEIETLQTLADASASALENARLLLELDTARVHALRKAAEIRNLFEEAQTQLRQREEAEAALRHAQERLQLALDAGKMAVCEWSAEEAGPICVNTLDRAEGGGVPPPSGLEVLARSAEAVHPDDRPLLRRAIRAAFNSGTTFEHEFRVTKPGGGSVRWVRGTGQVLPSRDGQQRMVGVIQDITERRRLMVELALAQKIESIGRLAGGVAHDFNNALTAITGSVELARRSASPQAAMDPAVRSALDTVAQAADHAAGLTRQLLAFARKQVLEPRVVDLNDLVRGTQSMIARLVSERISVRLQLEPGPCRVLVDPGQIEQVLVNLSINARDAMPAGGKLTFATSIVNIFPSDATYLADLKPGRYAVLNVTDTGVGMDQSVQTHVFEPFFTTKAAGSGTGLGLATVHGIVKQHGGHILLYSEPGRGTSFRIFLPIAGAEAEIAAKPQAAPQQQRGNENVLVVEDDNLVRGVAVAVFKAAGYSVIEAPSGEAAVEIARTAGRPIDLVVTDMVMPGINGRETVEALSAFLPGVRAIITSGYSEDVAMGNSQPQPNTLFLAKPYTPATLLAAARGLLDSAAAR